MENILNEQQPDSLPKQETTVQNTPTSKTKHKINIKKLLIILLVFLFITSTAVLIYNLIINPDSRISKLFRSDDNSSKISDTEQKEPISKESAFGKFTNKPINNSGCDNYQCLITAAQKCQPILATITYSNLPHPIFPGLVTSGHTTYEIKNISEGNICSLYISEPISTITITDESKKELIATGVTEEDIAAQIKTIQDSLDAKEVTQSKTICTGSGNVISEFLSDLEKGNVKVTASIEKLTYTTSSDHELECIVELPPKQKADTSSELTSEECTAKTGITVFADSNGNACYVGDTDLGRIVDKNITVNPPLQCCVKN